MEVPDAKQKKYLNRLQELYFAVSTNTGTPSQHADNLRAITSHLSLAKSQGIVPQGADSTLLREYEDEYGGIVDALDEKTGLNNYAKGALALCDKHKNESQQWKSSLTLESLQSKDFYKTLRSQSQAISQYYQPPGSENDLIFKETRKPPENLAQAQPKPLFRSGGFQHNNSGNNGNRGEVSVSGIGNHSNYGHERTNQNPRDGTESANTKDRRADNGVNFQRKRPLYSNNVSANRGGHSNFSTGQPSLYKQHQRSIDPEPENQFEEEEENAPSFNNPFKTAKQQLAIDNQKKFGRGGGQQGQTTQANYGTGKKSLGTRRGPSSKFIPPIPGRDENNGRAPSRGSGNHGNTGNKGDNPDEPVDERLKGIDPKMIELIMNEIMDHGPQLDWNDIAGLEFAKKTIKEIVVWPMLRPDIFTGLRGPPKGLLLFGPPGTGKTLIGKCIASQSKSTFFSISASSLTSKWVGEGEKMVRALFTVARCNQPAVVFIDEIDSLLSQRSDGEHEASRRIKTEFLVQLDGAGTQSEDRILVIGATNRPQEIDEAARRRFVKRLYIPLPDMSARQQIINNLLSTQHFILSDQDITHICQKTDGYSGADMANLCREAALGPVRSIPFEQIETITADQVPAITCADFEEAFLQVRASVSEKDLDLYIQWNSMFGSFGKT